MAVNQQKRMIDFATQLTTKKASEMLVAPRISEYVLKFLNF